MALVVQDGGIHGRCREGAEKSDIRPAGSARDVAFFPLRRSIAEQFSSLDMTIGP
jgi:hypothetical protein